MSLLLQISDPHFGTEQPAVMQALLQLVQAQRPEVLILSGDITQRGSAVQFTAARRYVQALAIPAGLVLPGNHDIPLFSPRVRLFDPYVNFRHAFGAELEPVLDHAALLAIGVNTTRRWRHKDGEVSAQQIERVAQRLRTAQPQQLRIVVTHQPVHVIRDRDEHNLLHNAEAAVRAWTEAGVDLVLGGHIHYPSVAPLGERYLGLPREAWGVQAGTALSTRVRAEAGNSVNLIRYGGEPLCCAVQRWDYEPAAAAFVCVKTVELSPDRRS